MSRSKGTNKKILSLGIFKRNMKALALTVVISKVKVSEMTE